MYSLLLVIIYIAFISLGLPDSLVGAAWPVMRLEFDVPISYAGIITMVIAGGTILSSLLSDRLTKKFGTGLVTAVSVALTAFAIFGFSVAQNFYVMCLIAVPYGLGAGAIDAALNNYVALHFSSRHMSWLHCCWGVGAAISPYIMSAFIVGELGYRGGYCAVSIIQLVLMIIMFVSLPLWKKVGGLTQTDDTVSKKPLGLRNTLKISGVPLVLLTFFAYCSAEATAMLWSSSYLEQARNFSIERASQFGSLFFLGITFGRFINGFVTEKLGDRKMIRIGGIIVLVGIALLLLPIDLDVFPIVGLMIVGLGCAPIYPSIIHSTPSNFGKENSQAIVGVQMASAYLGSTFMPPLFGLIAQYVNINLFPCYLLIFTVLMLVMSEVLFYKVGAKKQSLVA